MAQQKRVELLDDLDGSAADETVRFGLEGAHYEIDLSETNATELRTSMSEFLQHARRVGRDKPASQSAPNTPSPGKPLTARQERERTQAIRTWARAADYTVSDRGRIPAHIAEAYDRAH